MIRPAGLEWIGIVVDSPASGAPLLVWYEPSTDNIIDARLTEPGLRDAPELFVRATQEPKAGEARCPARIRVADPVLARVLDTHLIGVEVVVGDISEARAVAQSLAAYMSRLDPEPVIVPELWARHFRAAAALYRARPWDSIPSDEWIEVECGELGISSGALTVVGQMGESYGFALCRSVDDAIAWMDAAKRHDRAALPHQFFMFGYDDRRELAAEELAEVKQRGWEVAGPDAYPNVTVREQDGARLPTPEELAGITTIIESLSEMLADEPALADAWAGEPIEWQGRGARFRAPLDMPATPADPRDASLDILDEHGHVDEVLLDRYQSALMTRLAAREEIPDEVLAAAEMLVAFAAQYHGATFGTITAETLRALLLDTIPAQLAVEPDEAGRIVAAARELMRFAGEELGSRFAAGALALLDDAFERQLAGALADPTRFATGKQLVMAGIAAGYDMSTEDGVAEFVQAFANAQRTRSRKPKTTAKPKTKAKPKAKPKAKAKATAKPKAKARTKPATRRSRRR